MDLKKLVAKKVVIELKSRLSQIRRLGIGSGTTVRALLSELPTSFLHDLELIPTSIDTALTLRNLGLASNIREPDGTMIDLTIDGADKVTKNGVAIKGGGGALTREKIVRYHSKEFWIIVDESKVVEDLLTSSHPIPVEVLPFGFLSTMKLMERMFQAQVTLRTMNEKKLGPVVTDNGNYIVDVSLLGDQRMSVAEIEIRMKRLPGVVECGLFANPPCNRIFVSKKDGTVDDLIP